MTRITRAEIRRRVHKAYGPDLHKDFAPFGYFEGHKDEATEVGLHEFCHAFLLGRAPKRGKLNFEDTEKAIDTLPKAFQRNLQEVRAIATELILIRRLRLSLCRYSLLSMGQRNMEGDWSYERMSRAVEKASRTPAVKKAAKQVQGFLGISNQEMYGKS